MSKIKLKINDVPGYEPGRVIDVPVDSEGIIIDRFLTRRMKDAESDNCVERVKQSPKEQAK